MLYYNPPDTLELQRGKQLNNEAARCQLTIDNLTQENLDLSAEVRRRAASERRLQAEVDGLKAEILQFKSLGL